MPFEVCFKHVDVCLNNDSSHVAIRPDQQPLTRLQTVGLGEVSGRITQIAALADDMHAQTLPRRCGGAAGFVTQQRPMGPAKNLEQAYWLTPRTLQKGVRGAATRRDTPTSELGR